MHIGLTWRTCSDMKIRESCCYCERSGRKNLPIADLYGGAVEEEGSHPHVLPLRDKVVDILVQDCLEEGGGVEWRRGVGGAVCAGFMCFVAEGAKFLKFEMGESISFIIVVTGR